MVGRPKIYYESEEYLEAAAAGEDGKNTDGTEGEGHDRTSIALPDDQLALVEAMLGAVKPTAKVVLVLFNGGGLAIEHLMADMRVHAIVEGFFPGMAGATAMAESLYGEANRFSKMPYTLLGEAFTEESVMKDMSMTDPPGRGYRYYTGKITIVPFGFGLSYTTFSLKSAGLVDESVSLSASEAAAISDGARPAGQLRGASHELTTASVTVTNTGKIAGDEVVFLFHNATAATGQWAQRDGGDGLDPLAIKQLVAFERVSLAPGESKTVSFPVSVRTLSTVDKHGARPALAGEHGLTFSLGHGEELGRRLRLRAPEGRVLIG